MIEIPETELIAGRFFSNKTIVFGHCLKNKREDLLAGFLVNFLESSKDSDPRRIIAIPRQDAKSWNPLSVANEPNITIIQ
jgi:hypothetical protein